MAYRLHVGAFTGEADDVDNLSRGTFLGVLKKVSHLRRLGGCLYSLVSKVSDIISGMRFRLFCLSLSAYLSLAMRVLKGI